MANLFPELITNLPKADLPFANYQAYISQGEKHQIIFMQFDEDIDIPEHSHESQWGVVLEGKIELIIDGVKNTYTKGDSYSIGKGINHSGKIFAGYADITFFNQKDRYSTK
ncbi:cupin domain-containing protein|uniref:Cupin domain-containing protein n=1 Tax=Dendrosporobacter quercicolus TaxID=146817 RepID=A0A1G9X8B4_9FIRM|nr:cupin domain-containing protein [Dendrosporobacter quercicolus]NSL49928.1 cupin domain-containing protein [Dendrosporobacter quercicolus DSM 1736]SDM92573.1 Cupin domain-containing protein [Dendrosporobacter quercicolus]